MYHGHVFITSYAFSNRKFTQNKDQQIFKTTEKSNSMDNET